MVVTSSSWQKKKATNKGTIDEDNIYLRYQMDVTLNESSEEVELDQLND